MPENKRKMVYKPVATVDINYGTLESAADVIAELTETYGKNARVDYYTPIDSTKRSMYVFIQVAETDEEQEIRLSEDETYDMLYKKMMLNRF